MPDDLDWARLARYFAGECAADEADDIRRWIEADPARRRQVDELRAAWEAAATPSTSWDTPASWQRLAARVRARERRAEVALVRAGAGWPAEPAWRARARRWGAIAATVVAVAGGGVLWQRAAQAPDRTAVASAPPREVRTGAGERAKFTLADGSHVILAPGSVLRYDTTRFGVSTRELHLEGRAYFEVTHDARRPFLVHTARTVTEDLGTEFVITDYPGDPATEVVVATGTVAVRSAAPDTAEPTPATVLERGELVRLDSAGRATVRRGVDVAAHLAWTEGRLVFVEAPVGEVVAQLERWYGIEVQLVGRALAAQRFTGTYLTEPDSVVLRELATAIGAQIERRGDAVTLTSARSRP